MRPTLVALLTLTSAACSTTTVATPVRAPAPRAAPPEVQTLLEIHCRACHDDDHTERPSFGVGRSLSSDLAFDAVAMVSAGRMPPPPTSLTTADRARLVRALCGQATKSVASCVASYGETGSALARAPADFLRAVAHVEPDPQHRSQDVDKMLRSLVPPETRVLRFGVPVEVLATLLAAERCPSPRASEPDSLLAFRTCAMHVLDRKLLLVEPPVSPPPSAPRSATK